MFPTTNDEQPDLITLIGKKESVEAASKHLQERIKELVSALYLRYRGTCPLSGLIFQ